MTLCSRAQTTVKQGIMKRCRSLVTRVGSLLALLLSVGVSSGSAQTLLVNGGFEQWKEHQPLGWTRLQGSVTTATGAQDVRSGTRAVLLQPGEKAPSATIYSKQVDVHPDKLYRASVWVKGKGKFALGLYQYTATGKWLGGAGLGPIAVKQDWRKHVLYYAAAGTEARKVCVALTASGARAQLLVDDAVFEVVNPRSSAVLRRVDHRADWVGPSNRLKQVRIRAKTYLQFDARMMPQDIKRVDLADYFNFPVASAAAPTTWVSFGCSPFAVQPGATYQIIGALAARDVHTFHIKVCYFDREGKPYATGSGVRPWYRLGSIREGTWPFQRFVCRLTTPVTASKAKIEFWCKCGGEVVWLDDLKVVQVPSVPIHPSAVKVEWNTKGSEPPPLPPQATRKPLPVSFNVRATDRSRVIRDGDVIKVILKNGVLVKVLLRGDRVLGVGEVAVGSILLRNPAAPPLAPLVETQSGGAYIACLYEDCHVSQDDSVVLRTRLLKANGDSDVLLWHFAPHEVDIADTHYKGLALWYSFESASDGVIQIVDRATWEIGGTPIGVTVVDQNTYATQNVFRISDASPYCSGGGIRFVAGECLDYQFAPEGAILGYFERPFFIRYQRTGTPEFVMFRDAYQFSGEKRARTPRKFIVWTQKGDLDHWAQVRDFAYRRARRQVSIMDQTLLPIANVWTDWREMAKIGKGKYYEKIITDYLPAIARCGFKRILIHETWEHGGCSPSDLRINSAFGGEKALKRLCDAARSHGTDVIAWYGTGHLWTKSPLFHQHPEFRLRGRNGKPPTLYCWPDITGVDLTGPWFDYALSRLKDIRSKTGLGGLWLDSYVNFTHNVKCATRKLEIEQANALVRFHSEIQKIGYVTYTEASSDFGIKSNGFPIAGLDTPEPVWPQPHEFYDTSPYIGPQGEPQETRLAKGLIDERRYFRYVANKCVPFVCWRALRNRLDWQRKVGEVNRAFNSVVPFMFRRRLLPARAGIEWTSADGKIRVVFSFRDGTVRVPANARVWEMPSHKLVPVRMRQFHCQQDKVYLIQ